MLLTVHAKTRAKKDEIVAWLDFETAKVAVKAAPEKGKANAAIINLQAKHYACAPSLIILKRGATTTLKQFEIPD